MKEYYIAVICKEHEHWNYFIGCIEPKDRNKFFRASTPAAFRGKVVKDIIRLEGWDRHPAAQYLYYLASAAVQS
jgi:hypothetical protein